MSDGIKAFAVLVFGVVVGIVVYEAVKSATGGSSSPIA